VHGSTAREEARNSEKAKTKLRMFENRKGKNMSEVKKTLRLAPIEREGRMGAQREGRAE